MAIKLRGPQALLSGAPDSPEALLATAEVRARRRGMRTTVDARTLVVYVNHGRWVADCPHCDAGIAVDPRWPIAVCRSCFHTYASLQVPSDWAAVEQALVSRPMRHQHWITTETVADLEAENARRLGGGR